jgi:UDP-glucose 4-epimerase
MNILVTGGTGFIGSHTVIELFESGYTPIVIDNLSNSDIKILDGITSIAGRRPIFFKGDVQNKSLLNDIFSQYDPQGIIHFSAKKSVKESIQQPLAYWNNNIQSLLALLECAKASNAKACIFSSSATVYGDPDTLPIPETSPRKPSASPYGSTKQAGEDILRDTVNSPNSQIKGISLRYFNPIGAHPSGNIGELPLGTPQNLIPFVTQTAIGKRKKLTVFGNTYPTPDGTCLRDYIHVIDLAQAHIFALDHLLKENNAPMYDVFNVGTGIPSSVLEIIHTFEKVNKISLPFEIGPKRSGDIASCYADPQKANESLKWKAQKTLAEALEDAWNWEKKYNS